MSVEISLEPNNLTPRPGDWMAVVRNATYQNTSAVIKQITRPGSILKETECVAVITAFFNQINDNVREGIGFTSDYLSITPAAGGVFESENEAFDPSKHWKDANLVAGPLMRKAIADMKVKTIRMATPLPYVAAFLDIKTESRNQLLTPGFMADITGDLLKIEGDAAGVFFVNIDTSEVIAVPRIHVNEPKKLTILIPEALPAGSYKVEVRTHIHKSKDLRVGSLNGVLTIQ